MNKNTFLEFLKSATQKDLNEVIKEKGKPPKLIKAIIFYDNQEDKKLTTKQESN